MHTCNDDRTFPGHVMSDTLRLHLVVLVLISCDGELLRDYIAHVHEVLQTLLQDVVDVHAVCATRSA